MFDNCKLEGAALDSKVAELEGLDHQVIDGVCCRMLPYSSGHFVRYQPSSNWAHGGPIIERDQIFLSPPSQEHHHGGESPGWNVYHFWRATVSRRTCRRPNPSGGTIAPTTVGRGAGPTALVAAMRAFVDSHAK